jgi:acyl carrier protein
MNQNEVFNKVVEVCKDVFENDELDLNEASCAANVDEWDSLTHLGVISDLEEEFDISFSLDEVTNVKNLGELVRVVIKHLEA